MKKKAQLELSANFLVIIIISVIIVAGGLVIFFKLKGTASKYVDTVDSQTQEELKAMMLKNNYDVAVFPSDITLNKGDSSVVGLAVSNYLDSSMYFNVTTKSIYYFATSSSTKNDVSSQASSFVTYHDIGIVKSKNQGNKNVLVQIPSDASSGQYIITLQIQNCTASTGPCSPYNIVKIYVTTS